MLLPRMVNIWTSIRVVFGESTEVVAVDGRILLAADACCDLSFYRSGKSFLRLTYGTF